jgi:O-antigen ligase
MAIIIALSIGLVVGIGMAPNLVKFVIVGAVAIPIGQYLIMRSGMALFALGLLMASTLLSCYKNFVGSVGLMPEHLVGGLYLFLLMHLIVARRQKNVPLGGYTIFAYLWLIISVVGSVFNSPSPGDSMTSIVRISIMLGIFLSILITVNRDESLWRQLAKLWLFLCIIELSIGILGWVISFLGVLNVYGIVTYGTRYVGMRNVYGTLFERNFFGSFSASVLIAFINILLIQRRKRANLLAPQSMILLGISASLVALAISFTRAAWLAALLGLYLLSLTQFNWRNRSLRLPFFLVTILASVLAFQFLLIPLAPTLQSQGGLLEHLSSFLNLQDDVTVRGRLSDIQVVAETWQEHPFIGHGTASFGLNYPEMRGGKRGWIANATLNILYDNGILGVMLLALFFGGITYRGFKRANLADDPTLFTLLSSLCWMTVILLIAFQGTTGVWLGLFWVCLGLTESGAQVLQPSGTVPQPQWETSSSRMQAPV